LLAALADERRGITVTSAMVDAVAATTAAMRNLGDGEGGNQDNLRFVHHHLTSVAKLFRQARFTSEAVADRLLAEWAQLAQLAAWMANDASQHGRNLEGQLAQGALTLAAVTSRDSRVLRCAACPPCAHGAARWCCAAWRRTWPRSHRPVAQPPSDPCRTQLHASRAA
jgi:hypothetical protein